MSRGLDKYGCVILLARVVLPILDSASRRSQPTLVLSDFLGPHDPVRSNKSSERQSLFLEIHPFPEPIGIQPINKPVSFSDALSLGLGVSLETEMSVLLQAWHLLVFGVAGWVNRQRHDAIVCFERLDGLLWPYERPAAQVFSRP